MLLPIACRLLMTVHGDMQNNTGLNDSSTAPTPSSAPHSHSHSHGRLLTGLLVALNILLIIFIYMCFYKYLFSSNSTDTPPDSSPPSSPRPTLPLPLHIIRSIPIVEFKSNNININIAAEKPDCAVCLTEFKDGERLRILPRCAHQFHVDCIDTWFQSHADCPLCRSTPAD